ncbi:transmembrane protease serine 11A-like [Danaus plexippus]|uniref:transmembrane protease serine 11A-like n=1 Tax=Danaus plexippus TaxID=13037 RepID=UPI002AAF255F|nr:transmembrane protease serine 11A-like [Danaus plexippus]
MKRSEGIKDITCGKLGHLASICNSTEVESNPVRKFQLISQLNDVYKKTVRGASNALKLKLMPKNIVLKRFNSDPVRALGGVQFELSIDEEHFKTSAVVTNVDLDCGDYCTRPRQFSIGNVVYSVASSVLRNGNGFIRVCNIGTRTVGWKKGTTITRAEKCILDPEDLIPRIARWWLTIQEYDIQIEYRPGDRMTHVDALSRNPTKGYSYPSDIILPGRIPVWDTKEETSFASDERIVGGEEANIEDYPHQIGFLFQQNNNTYFCGGFIISEYYILTAGHCSQNVDPTTVVLRAGSSFRNNGTIIPIDEIVAHPEYDNPPYDKDVGFIRTTEAMQFSDTMKPIPLVSRNEKCRSQVAISGWGRTSQGASSIPLRLRDVKVPVVGHSRCKRSYPDILTRNMICVGNYILGGKGPCQGDSGGAVVYDGKACGIVSFGRICAQPLSPSVCADISAKDIRDFIFDNTGV